MKYIKLLLFFVFISCSRDITIMSYNVRNCKGMDNRTDIARTTTVIDKEKPDFVAIQELDSVTTRSNGKYMLGELAQSLGMYATYSPAINFDNGKYGIGLLSKTKPIGYRSYQLPGCEETRTLLVVEFPTLYVCTAHFSLTKEDRCVSSEIVTDIISKLKKPVLFSGDLNAEPETEEIQKLSNKLTPIVIGEKTYPADNPTCAIDYIFGTGLTVIESHRVENSMASDHRPIVARVKINSTCTVENRRKL